MSSDHAGYELRQAVVDELSRLGHEPIVVGPEGHEVDYPECATALARCVRSGAAARGIGICGSGVGIALATGKVPGIRAAVCHDTYSARQAVEHDDLNVMCLGAGVVAPLFALELVRTFISARFDGIDRHVRRLEQIALIEQGGTR